MIKIFEYMRSPEFWFGGIFVGVFVNIVCYYLIPKFDVTWGKFSKKRATRNEELRIKRQKRIAILISNTKEQEFALMFAVYKKISALKYLVFAIPFMLMFLDYIKYAKFDVVSYRTSIIIYVAYNSFLASCTFYCLFRSLNYLVESEDIVCEVLEARESIKLENE